MARLVLIRHGESKSTVARSIGGPRTCGGLSPLGVRQTTALRDRLARSGELVPDMLIASGYRRAQQTARPLAELWGLPLVVEPEWGEHDPGPLLDGMGFDEYVQRYGTPDWDGPPDAVLYEGGETVREFDDRIAAVREATIAAYPDQTIVVVCHGGVVDRVFRQLLGLPTVGGFVLHTLNTSITEFQQIGQNDWPELDNQQWMLRRYNDAAHLAGLPAETPRATSDTA